MTGEKILPQNISAMEFLKFPTCENLFQYIFFKFHISQVFEIKKSSFKGNSMCHHILKMLILLVQSFKDPRAWKTGTIFMWLEEMKNYNLFSSGLEAI